MARAGGSPPCRSAATCVSTATPMARASLISTRPDAMPRRRARRDLPRAEGLEARGRRRRRPDRQFPAGARDFHRPVLFRWPPDPDAAHRQGRRGRPRRGRRLPEGRPGRLDRRRTRSMASRTCSASSRPPATRPCISSSRATARKWRSTPRRSARTRRRPSASSAVGVLGVSAGGAPEDWRSRTTACRARRSRPDTETWYVVARTGSYLGGLVVGRESAEQLSGPIRIAEVSGEVAKAGLWPLFNLAAILSISIGLLEPAAGSAARRRPPALLRLRSGARKGADAEGAGIRSSGLDSPSSRADAGLHL